jgi:hypothetical protein
VAGEAPAPGGRGGRRVARGGWVGSGLAAFERGEGKERDEGKKGDKEREGREREGEEGPAPSPPPFAC